VTPALLLQVWVTCRGEAKEQETDFVQHCADTVRVQACSSVCIAHVKHLTAHAQASL
jgi:hypothetical protein